MNIRDIESMATQFKEPLETLVASLTHRDVEKDEKGYTVSVTDEPREQALARVAVALGLCDARVLVQAQGGLLLEDHTALRFRERITGESYQENVDSIAREIEERREFPSKPYEEWVKEIDDLVARNSAAAVISEFEETLRSCCVILDPADLLNDGAGAGLRRIRISSDVFRASVLQDKGKSLALQLIGRLPDDVMIYSPHGDGRLVQTIPLLGSDLLHNPDRDVYMVTVASFDWPPLEEGASIPFLDNDELASIPGDLSDLPSKFPSGVIEGSRVEFDPPVPLGEAIGSLPESGDQPDSETDGEEQGDDTTTG